jgi:tetratricopeptide (TPR) repeat protein
MSFIYKACISIQLACLPCLWAHDNLLVAVLMVKDEAPVIRETLLPLAEGGVTHFLIFDTGSTDDTIARIQTFFTEYNIPQGIIRQEPFVDFATSRNQALRSAEELFPDTCFILMPDAEWCLHNTQGLLAFCNDHRHDTDESYLMRIMDRDLDFYTPRLIRMHASVHFVGVVHEALNQVSSRKVPGDIFFKRKSSLHGTEKSRRRWLRDQKILLQACEQNPHDTRMTFYLAQTYACLGDWHNARIWYERRVALHGWDEENFMARYRLAQAYAALEDWNQALSHYLKAYSLRPQRAEPLVALAQHYWDTHEFELAFIFARRALELPYPATDVLFVEKWLYEYTRHDLFGRIAWYVGAYDSGEAAVRTALRACPDAAHLHRNLSLYEQINTSKKQPKLC